MDTLPRELIDAVVQQLADYDFPESARFPVLDDAARETILNVRLVGPCFRASKTLDDLFVAVMEETPFLWHGNEMPRLFEVSRSKLAAQMKTLTLCGMNSEPWHKGKGSDPQCDRRFGGTLPKHLTNVLRRFVRVKHLRYYPISPKCFREARPSCAPGFDVVTGAYWGYPPDDDVIHSWLIQQREPTWIWSNTLGMIVEAGVALESVTFPLFGNRASYCGIQICAVYFPPMLKRLTISLTDRLHDIALFEPWLGSLKSLKFLEVAVSRNPDSLGPWNSFASCRRLTYIATPTSRDELPRLEELRLMADNQICFSESDLLQGLQLFPNLRKLGFAHMLIKSELNNTASWESFVKRLVPKKLERLWLLDPRNLWTDGQTGRAGYYKMVKYKADDNFRAVATEVRLIDTNSLWAKDTEPPKRRDFEYPGFAIFEQTSQARPL